VRAGQGGEIELAQRAAARCAASRRSGRIPWVIGLVEDAVPREVMSARGDRLDRVGEVA
jgi:hypothetical protein